MPESAVTIRLKAWPVSSQNCNLLDLTSLLLESKYAGMQM
jgi:hypothetical protein